MSSSKSFVFFDVGNTLVLPNPSVGHIIARVARSYGYDFSADYLEGLLPHFHQYYALEYERDNSFWAEEARVREIWLNGYALVLRKAGVELYLADITQRVYEEFDQPSAWQLYPSTIEVLRELKESGLGLGVISNWGVGLQSLLEGLGVGQYLDVVVASAAVNFHKPQPEIFKHALSTAMVEPCRCIHVGDHLVADVRGAQSVGIEPILITHDHRQGFDEYEPEDLTGISVATSMPEVREIIKRMCR